LELSPDLDPVALRGGAARQQEARPPADAGHLSLPRKVIGAIRGCLKEMGQSRC